MKNNLEYRSVIRLCLLYICFLVPPPYFAHFPHGHCFKSFSNLDTQQQYQISGTVTDSYGPMPGVHVLIKGSNTGTFTDANGEYSLLVNNTDILVYSYLGYHTRELAVLGRTNLDVEMQSEVTELQEVEVNAGYYTVKERERTGSMSRVTAEEIALQPIVSPLEALQGRMAGVEVVQQNGIPGSAPTIRIRGQNSLRNSREDNGNLPLYIIDGMPINSAPISGGSDMYFGGMDPLSTLDLSSIESIEVLKDADATSIYGSRGANGVVLITTKKGYGYNRKTEVEARWYSGLGTVSRKMELLDTQQYLGLRRAVLENDDREPDISTDYDLLLWDQDRYTDWQEELFGGTSTITDVHISASGGNATTSFRLGSTFHREGMVFPGDNQYQKVTTNLNLNHISENKKLAINVSASYGFDKNDTPAYDSSFVSRALSLAPNAPEIYNEDGSLHWEKWEYSPNLTNPLAAILNRTSTDLGNNIVANLSLSYQLLQGMSLKVNAGHTDLFREYKGLFSKDEYRPDSRDAQNHRSTQSLRKRISTIIEPQLIYRGKLGNGNLDGLLGLTYQQNRSKSLRVSGEGFASEALIKDLSAAEVISVSDNRNIMYRYNAIFARLGYNWKEKYFINITGRRDGSSRFGPNKRFANFGAVGGAWIFSEEPFIKNHLSLLSFGKLRGSFGTTGSDQIGDYGYLDAYEATRGPGGLYPTQLFNPDYSWEVNKKVEVALELGFIGDRIHIGASWYRNRSSNQLVGFPLPSLTGFGSVQANLPATVQNTGWEFEISTRNISTKNFNWQTFINFTVPNNKLVRFPGMDQTAYANRYRVGHPLSIGLLYQYDGIDPETGLYRMVDINEDGRYDYTDRTVIKNLGSRYFGGITNNISYKGLGLRFSMDFVARDSPGYHIATPGTISQQTADFYGAWQDPENNDIQRISLSNSASAAYRNYLLSERYISDASFLRLKTLGLSYGLPGSFLKKANLRGCTLFLQGQNLFTLTGYKGLNVENPGDSSLPALRTITLGIQLQL